MGLMVHGYESTSANQQVNIPTGRLVWSFMGCSPGYCFLAHSDIRVDDEWLVVKMMITDEW